MLVHILGWIGNIGFMSGSFYIARKNILGFYMFGIANGIYIYIGVMKSLPSLWAISIYLLALDLYGIINWQKVERNEKCHAEK